MKSNLNNKQCKECYSRAKKNKGTLLPCEATGFCVKKEKDFRRNVNAL